MEGNIYKPRYKIAFLAKSKVWIYKESRLRRFFNIRGRKLVRRGLFKRYVLVFNNMKWTVARRYIRPFMRRRASTKRRYKTAFYNKQQLRHFYGKFKEEKFRNLFRSHLVGVYSRNNSFYSTLERRIDMFLFRARHLPTLYAANQFVQHQGVEYNGIIERSPNALVGPGTSLVFDPYFWDLFSELLYDRIDYRYYGQKLLKKRIYHRLKKKVRALFRRGKRINRKYVLYFQLLRKTKSMNKILSLIIRFFVEKNLKNRLSNMTEVEYGLVGARSEKPDLRKHIESLQKELDLILKAQTTLRQTTLRLTKNLATVSKLHKANNFRVKLQEQRGRKKIKRLNYRLARRLYYIRKRSRFLFLKNPLWSTIINKKGLKYKVRKRNEIKAYVFKLLKSLLFLYTRVANLFVLDKAYNFNSKYSILSKFISNLRMDLVKAEESYFSALELKRQNRTQETKAHVENTKDIYKKTGVKLKALLALYNQMNSREKELNNRVSILKEKFSQLAELFMDDFKNKRIYKRWKSWKTINQKTKEQKVELRRNGLYYFIVSRRFKRRRRRAVPRLKMVHWYIPTYIHFDFNTMESIMLHDPLPSEIYHSFKCSLPKLHAFYRSRGL